MDFQTVIWFAPFMAAVTIGAWSWRRSHNGLALSLCLAVIVIWAATWMIAGVTCVIEGFADGPLPVECRPEVGHSFFEPPPAPLAARFERNHYPRNRQPQPQVDTSAAPNFGRGEARPQVEG